MDYLIIDTREKPSAIQSILKHFDSEGVTYEKSKLLFGDYMDYNRPQVVVDRKQNIAELAKNCTTEHERFVRELERCKKAGSKLVILVEQNRYKDRGKWVPVRDIADLMLWSDKYTTIRGEKVFRVLSAWCARYPVEVRFCDKRQTGKEILRIIYGDEHE